VICQLFNPLQPAVWKQLLHRIYDATMAGATLLVE
jgi:hypothetical protein